MNEQKMRNTGKLSWYNTVMGTTKESIAKAIKQCMLKAPLEDITVKEVCLVANLSRQTFYRCFQDKYDLINWYFDTLLNASFDQMGAGRTIREGLDKKFTYIQNEKVFFKAAFSYSQQNNLRDHDFEKIFGFYKNLYKEKSGVSLKGTPLDLLEMYCQSSVYMTAKWILKDCPNTPQKLTELMVQAMPEELRNIFNKLDILE